MDAWTLYWVTRLDGIKVFLTASSFVCFLGLGVLIVVLWNSYLEGKMHFGYGWYDFRWRLLLTVLSVLLIIGLPIAATLTPTTKEAAVILLLPKVANSEFVQEDLPAEGREMYGLVKEWLKKQAGAEEKE